MPQLRNLIITCGTSQTMRSKLDNEPMKLYDAGWVAFERNLRPGSLLDDPNLLDTEVSTYHQERILSVLTANWDQRACTLGIPNCFSAEISTLTALQNRNDGADEGWDPANDRIVLLSSDTLAGQFNARILQRALIEIWKVPQEHVNLVVVPGLNENPASPHEAMSQLAEKISQHMLDDEAGCTWRNIFVATGGFKSSLPTITIFSMVFGVEMVYMYEQSKHLQSLYPRLNDDEGRQYWEDTWNKMAQKGWLSAMLPGYLRIALMQRLKRIQDQKQKRKQRWRLFGKSS